MEFNLVLILTLIANTGFNSVDAVHRIQLLGEEVTVNVLEPIFYIVNRDGNYDAEADEYAGHDIPDNFRTPLCVEIAKILEDCTRNEEEQPDFGAFSVTFSNTIPADVTFYNLLECPATPKNFYVMKWWINAYAVFRRYAGDAIVITMTELLQQQAEQQQQQANQQQQADQQQQQLANLLNQ